MKGKLFAIYDGVAKEYSAPMFLKNEGVAARVFQQQMKEVEDNVNFDLVFVGEYDTEDGFPEGCKPVHVDIMNAMEVRVED